MVEDLFHYTINKYQLVKKRDRIILGVSGGPDSVCMLHLFCCLREKLNLKLICAHFNHQLREEADKDEEFVAGLCQERGIKFISEKKDVRKFFQGDSLEQTARNLRLDFFLKCSREFKVKKIALAHTKDDLVETVLMRIIRGSALRGLRSILPKSKVKGVTFIRPLIEIEKEAILSWLKGKKKAYCIDKTNFEDKFFRNKIRRKLIPFLRQFNPNICGALFNLARTVSLDYDFIYRYAKDKLNEITRSEGRNFIRLKVEEMKKLHPAVVNNIIRIAIEELKGDLKRLEAQHLEEVEKLVSKDKEDTLLLPGILIKREDENLFLLRRQ